MIKSQGGQTKMQQQNNTTAPEQQFRKLRSYFSQIDQEAPLTEEEEEEIAEAFIQLASLFTDSPGEVK